MTPIRTSACNITFVLAGCADLPASRGEADGIPFISTYWKPDAEELAMIAAGMPIKLSILGERPQPVSLEVDTL